MLLAKDKKICWKCWVKRYCINLNLWMYDPMGGLEGSTLKLGLCANGVISNCLKNWGVGTPWTDMYVC